MDWTPLQCQRAIKKVAKSFLNYKPQPWDAFLYELHSKDPELKESRYHSDFPFLMLQQYQAVVAYTLILPLRFVFSLRTISNNMQRIVNLVYTIVITTNSQPLWLALSAITVKRSKVP